MTDGPVHPGLRAARMAVGLSLALVLGACRYGEDLLVDREPTVDPRRAFPGFVDSGDGGNSPRTGTAWEFAPCDGWPSAGRVGLGALFTAQIPPDGRWDSAGSARAMLVVGRAGASFTPTSFVYAERIGAGGLGLALRRFQGRIDRRLSDWLGPRVPRPDGATTVSPSAGAGQETATAPAVSDLVRAGYRSDLGTFTGWRWVGRCGSGQAEAHTEESGEATPAAAPAAPQPWLHLSRTRGSWRQRPDREPVPAFMILATITVPDHPEYGVHVAIVCTDAPQCADAPALARLLGSIRVAANPDSTADWGTESLPLLATEVGLTLPDAAEPEPAPAE